MRRKTVLLALAALAAALAAGAALSATTSVTITSPTTNQAVSLHKNPYLAVAGSATFADTSAGTTRFFLRRDACGTLNDNPHLSTTSGTDGGNGCGLTVDTVGAVGCAGANVTTDYPANGDGMPLAYNGTQPINGQVSLTGAQAGEAQVVVTLTALVGGQATTIGTATGTALLDPTAAYTPVPFTIDGNSALDGADLQDIDLNVKLCGPNVYSQFTELEGASYFDLPDYAASVNKSVSVSIDDPTFANAVSARLAGSSWSVAVPTPAVGTHTIYVQSHQGYDSSAVATTTFKVTK